MTRKSIITLVRHGETAANLEGVWHGSIDTPLTDRGLAQAERVARYLEEFRGEVAALYKPIAPQGLTVSSHHWASLLNYPDILFIAFMRAGPA